jgi:hypothetical protein
MSLELTFLIPLQGVIALAALATMQAHTERSARAPALASPSAVQPVAPLSVADWHTRIEAVRMGAVQRLR